MPLPHPLTRLIAACEPGTPAGSEVYVRRQRPVAERLLQAIGPSHRMRALVVGQTGVGKSTELRRVNQLASGALYGLRVPIDEFLDLDVVTWHDILVFSACTLSTEYPSAESDSLAAAFQPLRNFEMKILVGGPPEPTPVQRFRNDFHSVHQTIESAKAQFWDLACSVLSAVQEVEKAAFILIWDGLEKMSLASARRLFGDEGQFLNRLPCRVIVTAPLSLTFDESFAQIEEHFSYIERLRAVSVEPNSPGEKFCLDLLTQRGVGAASNFELVFAAIRLSGGVPRQLLQVVSYAAKQALSDGQDQITPESLLRARNRLAEKWQYQLGPSDYAALAKADEDREPAERARLLQLGACIEHDQPEGGLQIDVNPLVVELMRRRTAKSAERKRG